MVSVKFFAVSLPCAQRLRNSIFIPKKRKKLFTFVLHYATMYLVKIGAYVGFFPKKPYISLTKLCLFIIFDFFRLSLAVG